MTLFLHIELLGLFIDFEFATVHQIVDTIKLLFVHDFAVFLRDFPD